MIRIQDNIYEIETIFDDSATFDTSFNDDNMFQTSFGDSIEVSTSDHRKLTYRDAEQQHPIGAIENLNEELEVRPDEILSNMDIYEILQH